MPIYLAADPFEMNVSGVVKTHFIPTARNAVVSGGNAVFYLTADNTPAGTPIYTNVFMDCIMLRAVETDAVHTFGAPVVSVDKRTLTVPIKKSSGINVALVGLTLLGAPVAANGSSISLFVIGE